MLRRINWLSRGLGYIWIGVMTFAIIRPTDARSAGVQIAAYVVVGLGLATWARVEAVAGRSAGLSFSPVLTSVLAVIAVAGGLGAGAGSGGYSMVTFVFVASMIAGSGVELDKALVVAASGALGIEVGALLTDSGVAGIAALPIFPIAGLIIGRNWRGYRVQAEQSAALLERSEQLRREQRRADRLDERTRLAREIHDVLAHSLGALGIQVQAARAVLADRRDIVQADALLAEAQRMASEGLVETRHAIEALRSDPRPLVQELAQTGDTHAQRYRVPVDLDVTGEPVSLPPEATLALLRVTQEALVNAAKHAPGQSVAISVRYDDSATALSVCNRLQDAAAAEGVTLDTVNGGYGLTGMRERISLLGGTITAGTCDTGWVVSATVPHDTAHE